MRPAIYITQAKQGTVQKGHPWIFPKAIQKIKGSPITGELVDVFSLDNNKLGVGIFNEHSLYRVRMLAQGFETMDTHSITQIVNYRLHQALLLRRSLNLPNSETNAFRLCNSEGDYLPGLTIDRFNETCVVSSSAFWVEAHKPQILECLQNKLPQTHMIWAPQIKHLKQDGWENEVIAAQEGKEKVLEEGITYQIDFTNIQKTGLFLDQRENHQRIAKLAYGKRVLDLYTYSGGFALHAAKAGATQVTAVDSSEQAISLAQQNAVLNQLEIEFIKADARNFLTKTGEYDLIILDPPKLVPSKRHIEQAKNYYRFLHREAFKHMKPGSLLMTCNCSSALSSQQFAELVSLQAIAVNKTIRILGIFGPASCHPTLAFFPEGQYLTALLIAVV